MVGVVTIRTFGFRDLDRRLLELPNRTRKPVLVRALKKAAAPTLASARENAPVGLTGHLEASLAIGTKLTARQAGIARGSVKSTAEINIGPSSDGSTGVLNYAHLSEFGSINNVGTFWLTRAYETNKGRAVEIMRAEVLAAIEKALRRGSGVGA